VLLAANRRSRHWQTNNRTSFACWWGDTKTEEAANLKSYATQSAADIHHAASHAAWRTGAHGASNCCCLSLPAPAETTKPPANRKEELRHSAWQYQMLFDSIDEAFCIVELILTMAKAPVDYFLEVNPAFEKQTGIRTPKAGEY
jgi:hypothetical protein